MERKTKTFYFRFQTHKPPTQDVDQRFLQLEPLFQIFKNGIHSLKIWNRSAKIYSINQIAELDRKVLMRATREEEGKTSCKLSITI